MTLFESLYERACNLRFGSRCRLRRKVRHTAIIVSLASATFAVAAQTIVDGPNACGASPLGWTKYTDDALQVETMYGTRSMPLEQCASLLPGEICVSVYAYNPTNGSVTDVFTGPPPRLLIPAAGYPDSIAIDPSDQNHLLYIARDELIETHDRGQSWHHVNDMVAVRASAGRGPGDYILNFTPDSLTLIEGNQVSDDSGRNWRTLSHAPHLVTHQSVYYNYGFLGGWRSNDRGSSWSALMMNGYPFNFSNSWTADATDSRLVYAWVSGNFGYRVARSRDGGDNWTVLMNVGLDDPITLSRVLASPDTADLVYVLGLDKATQQVQLWKSTDAGDRWTSFGAQVSARLTAAGCGSAVFLSGVLNRHLRGVPLVFNTSTGSMILFDALAAPRHRNFNGDGKDDVVWANSSTGEKLMWLMNGGTITGGGTLLTDLNWSIAHYGDFNGDGRTDLLWRNTSAGETVMWLMNGAAIAGGGSLLTSTAWSVIKVGDFNGDGKTDLLWRNSVTGEVVIWLMNGSTFIGGGTLLTDLNSIPSLVADFNGDGKDDILWRNAATGQTVIWLMNGTAFAGGGTIMSDANWTATHVADFNGDGKADIVWRHTSGATALWLMNGASFAGGTGLLSDPTWFVVGADDLNGDGNADILWRNSVSGGTAAWLMNGTTLISGAGLLGPNWQITRTADVNGDGMADILWTNTATGDKVLWLMNGTSPSSGYLLSSDPNWSLLP